MTFGIDDWKCKRIADHGNERKEGGVIEWEVHNESCMITIKTAVQVSFLFEREFKGIAMAL